MNSSTALPLVVICHPPLMRSTSPCEKMSRSGTRAARRLVRSAHSRPLVAKMAGHVVLEVFHDGEAVRIAHQDLQRRDLEIHTRLNRSAPHRRCTRKGIMAYLPELVQRYLAFSSSLQYL